MHFADIRTYEENYQTLILLNCVVVDSRGAQGTHLPTKYNARVNDKASAKAW